MHDETYRNIRSNSTAFDLHEIFDNAPMGIFVSTPDGRLLFANPALARMHGYDSLEEFLGSVTDIAAKVYETPADRVEFQRLMDAHGQAVDHECLFRRKNGSVFWGALNARAVRDPSGKSRHYQGFMIDITKRKQAEEALRQKEKLYRTIFEGSRDGYVMVDPSGRIIDANRAFCDMLGYSIDELRQMEDFYSITPSYWIEWEEEDIWRNRLLGRGYSGVYEKEYIRKDGSIFPVELQSYAIRDEDGNIQFLWGTARDITSRKQTRQSLTESEKKYREILAAIEDGYYETDLAGNITFCNEAAPRMLGYATEEYIGLNFKKICKQPLKVFRAFHRVYKSGRPIKALPVEVVRKDGSTSYGELSITPMKNDRDRPVGFRGVARDITDRRRAEEALMESRRRLQVLVGNLPGMAYRCRNDQDWTMEYVSQGSLALCGYAPQELVNNKVLSFNDVIHPEDREWIWETWQAKLRRRQKVALEYEILCKDGSVKWVWEQGQGIFSKNGELEALEGFILDITERRRSEEALRQSEERARGQRAALASLALDEAVLEGELSAAMRRITEMLAKTMNIARAGVWILSDDRFELRCLSLFEAQTGLHSSGAVLKTATFPRYFDALLARSRIHAHDAQADPRTSELTKGYLAPLGITSMLDAGILLEGRLAGVVCLEHIGAPRQWRSDEEAFASTAAALVAQVMTNVRRRQAEQERENLQSQLLQAQKMESVGILAGGVAHDFNNLLQTMRGNIELLLQDKPEDDPDARRLQAVTRSMDRAAQLVQQLLLFSRKAESRKAPVDLNQEVENVARILERTIPKMIALKLQLDPLAWPLLADPVQVEQALLNLSSNAVDAMPGGGWLIFKTVNALLDEDFVSRHPGAAAGRHVLLTVSDTGCGMDSETLAHVFDPFFTTKEVGKGTGLGLASVYGIVKSHGGFIQCLSEPGLGTKFRLYWPAVDPKEVCPDVGPPKDLSFQSDSGSETILVVDDEQGILELTREALEMLGYSVMKAVNGEQALDIYRKHGQSIDLVLLDLNMPGMGGYKCLQELLRHDPQVKVVIASGYAANIHGKDALSSGAKGFISKPYRLQELAAIVRGALDEKENACKTM